MKNPKRIVQAFELVGALLLLLALPAGAQEKSVRPATDAEAAAGANVRAYINPLQLLTYGGVGGGPTNGITQAQFTAGLASGTNVVKATTLNASGATTAQAVGADSLVVTNGADLRGTTSASTLNVTNVVWFTLAAGTGKTNMVFIDSAGHFVTNDLATFVASLGSGGGISHVYITNDFIYSTNTVNHQTWFVDTNAIAHLQMNGVDVITLSTNALTVTTGSSNYLGGSNFITSPFVLSPNTYLATQDGSTTWTVGTLYTNGPYRAVMRFDISSTSGGTGSPNQVFFHYTNSAAGKLEQAYFSLLNGDQRVQQMNVELDPNATFRIDTIISTSGSISFLNMRLSAQ